VGRFGLESLSRGAKRAVFCDKEYDAINIIKQNIEKTRVEDLYKVLNMDYAKAIEELKKDKLAFDIIFLDPPYEFNGIEEIINKIIQYNMLNKNGIIIIESNNKLNIGNKHINIYDERKYGKVYLTFLNQIIE